MAPDQLTEFEDVIQEVIDGLDEGVFVTPLEDLIIEVADYRDMQYTFDERNLATSTQRTIFKTMLRNQTIKMLGHDQVLTVSPLHKSGRYVVSSGNKLRINIRVGLNHPDKNVEV